MLTRQARSYPTCVCSAFGRLFYGVDGRVYFSQVFVDDIGVLGKCYQNNDPTSSEVSDILDTDGGEIPIQNTGYMHGLVEFGSGILVFAENGVWFIGSDSGFSATSYAVQKISEEEVVSTRGIAPASGSVYFAAKSGVFVVLRNEQGQILTNNITENRIDTLARSFMKERTICTYDSSLKRLHVLDVSSNDELLYEERTGGWYKHNLGVLYLIDGCLYVPQVGIKYAATNSSGLNSFSYRFIEKTREDFLDYGGYGYEAYIESQPETLGQFSRDKRIVSASLFFRKTETLIQSYDEVAQDFVYDKPSSCNFTAKWGFDESDTGGRWTTPKQIYKPLQRKPLPISYPWVFDTGESVIGIKTGVRGYGKAVKFRFDSEDGKDMQLLGYNVEYKLRGKQ